MPLVDMPGPKNGDPVRDNNQVLPQPAALVLTKAGAAMPARKLLYDSVSEMSKNLCKAFGYRPSCFQISWPYIN